MSPVSEDPVTIGARIETLVHNIGTLEDSRARTEAQELVRLLMTLYGAGFSRMLDIVRTEAGGPQAVLERFAEDGLISSLLVLHDLHPHPVGARVTRALAGLQPHLPRHTNVILVDIKEDVVHLRVEHAPSGRLPAGNVRAAIERAVQEAAPEIARIEIDGLGQEAAQILLQIIRVPSTEAAGPTGA